MNDISYSKFIAGLNLAGLEINRKMLSEVAISDPAQFTKLVEVAKKALNGEIKAPVKEAKTEKAVKEVKKEAPKKEAKAEKTDLSSKTVAELKEMAKAAGIENITGMKKADLIAALEK